MIFRNEITLGMQIVHDGHNGRHGWKGTVFEKNRHNVLVRFENHIEQSYSYSHFCNHMRIRGAEDNNKGFYFLWSPESNVPLTERILTYKEIKGKQKQLEFQRKRRFFVVQSVGPHPDDVLTEHYDNSTEDNMEQVKLLKLNKGDKIIEITEKQAKLLGAVGPNYTVTDAIRSGDVYLAATPITVTKIPEMEQKQPLDVRIVNDDAYVDNEKK